MALSEALPAMPVLVGKYRTDIVPDLCLIDAQVCAHVPFERDHLSA